MGIFVFHGHGDRFTGEVAVFTVNGFDAHVIGAGSKTADFRCVNGRPRRVGVADAAVFHRAVHTGDLPVGLTLSGNRLGGHTRRCRRSGRNGCRNDRRSLDQIEHLFGSDFAYSNGQRRFGGAVGGGGVARGQAVNGFSGVIVGDGRHTRDISAFDGEGQRRFCRSAIIIGDNHVGAVSVGFQSVNRAYFPISAFATGGNATRIRTGQNEVAAVFQFNLGDARRFSADVLDGDRLDR